MNVRQLFRHKILQPVILVVTIITIGTIGYSLMEGFDWFEGLYMTVITVATVGYGEVEPLTKAGRVFTIILILVSWSSFAFALARITQYLISGELNAYFKNRQLMKHLLGLNNHTIICGFGRNGQMAYETLIRHQVPVVVIEQREDLVAKFEADHPDGFMLKGNATEDEILLQSGIQRASALISTLPVDADNVFIVISARALSPSLQIISRASEHSTYGKLVKAGADNVIMPDKIGGAHMAALVSKPDVIEFIDFLTGSDAEAENMESIAVDDLHPYLIGKTIKEVAGFNEAKVNVVGYKALNGRFVVNAYRDTQLQSGMKLIVLGKKEQINKIMRGAYA